MKVKTFIGWTEKGIDKRVNEFLEDSSIEIVDIKFSFPLFLFSAMVIYKDKYVEIN
jgi:hypothetical protein